MHDNINEYIPIILGVVTMIFGLIMVLYSRKNMRKAKSYKKSSANTVGQKITGSKNFRISQIPQFYQIDGESLNLIYNTINNEPYVDEKINSKIEISGGINIKPVTLELRGSSSTDRKISPPTVVEKYGICLIYYNVEGKLIADLEELVIEDNELSKYQEFKKNAAIYNVTLDEQELVNIEQELKHKIAEQLVRTSNTDLDSLCFLNRCEFTIELVNDKLQLVYIHPISSQLGTDIRVIVRPLIATISEAGREFFYGNLNKTTEFTVFGKMKKVRDNRLNSWEIQINPLAIC